MDHKDFVKISFKNRKLIEKSGTPVYPGKSIPAFCGCYYCCRTFSASEIKEWTDRGETALCPKCGIDSVVVSNHDEHESFIEALKKAEKEFF